MIGDKIEIRGFVTQYKYLGGRTLFQMESLLGFQSGRLSNGAAKAHDPKLSDDIQYPPGQGIPQWKLTRPIPGRVAAVLARGADIFRL